MEVLHRTPKEEDMTWMEAELSDEDEADGEEGVDFVKICTQFGAKQTFEYISN